MDKSFASQYPRNENGWILFPRDVEYRRSLFPNPKLGSVTDVFQHPAKMQLYLVESLVEYLTEPGDWILDPFGGTGSTALALRSGRNVVLIEIEESFNTIIHETAELLVPNGRQWPFPGGWSWEPVGSPGLGELRVYVGDNRKMVPLMGKDKIKAVITSPPYSTALKNAGRLQASMREEYAHDFANMGNLNPFYWEQAMKELWQAMAQVVVPGGYVAMINKDMMRSGQRENLSLGLLRGALGFQYKEWYKWATPGTQRTLAMKAKGAEAVLDEDILIFRKG